MPGAVCVSVDAKEASINIPAITHAVTGTRVFTGTPAIVIMLCFDLLMLTRIEPCAGSVATEFASAGEEGRHSHTFAFSFHVECAAAHSTRVRG